MLPELMLVTILLTNSHVDAAIHWHDQYRSALHEAETAHQLVFVLFSDRDERNSIERVFDQLGHDEQQALLARRHIFLSLPMDASVDIDGETTRLLEHGAFADLTGSPGVAVIDMTDVESANFHRVVSLVPISSEFPGEVVNELLQLPLGSLTQRTLTLAVRMHPEKPMSARQQFLPELAGECESHASYQARIGIQGHHNWETRFHRINDMLGGSKVAQEVCAESWPGQNLWEAARECVHSWRQSPGHWEAVQGAHPVFGYDMKRGENGIWYGVGIFAHER